MSGRWGHGGRMVTSRLGLMVVLVAFALFVPVAPAMAATFNKTNVISDANFRATSSMTAAEIQTFLDGMPGVLKSLTTTDYAGVQKSAAVIIADACTAWNVSPKVMLATLQKEQSLLTYTNPSQKALDWAVGMGYTDTVIYPQYKGFGNQIWCGTRALSNYETTYGWYPGKTMSVLDLDGKWVTITPANAATFAQYTYTPHVSGVQLFWTCYNRYFGDPLGWPPVAGGGALTGMVTAVGGGGLSGASVSVSLGPSTSTATDGRYSITGIAPGAHTVTFFQPGYASQTTSTVISAGITITRNAELTSIPTTGSLCGTVTVAGSGASLSNVVISVSGSASTTTAADGSYSIQGIAVGTHTVTFTKSGYVTQSSSRVISPGATTTLSAALVQCGILSGQVIGADGAGLPGVTVGVSAPGSHILDYAKTWLGTPYLWGGTTRSGVDCSGLTQAVGSEVGFHSFPRTAGEQWDYFQKLGWVVTEPRPGDFVYFKSPSSPSGYHTGIYVSSGTILDAPASGKDVRIENMPSLQILGYGRFQVFVTTTTGAGGGYAISRMEPSSYSVVFSAPGYVSQSPPTTILPGQTASLNISLIECGVLSGTVTAPGGVGLSGATVSIPGKPSTTTTADGGYSIEGLAPGGYTVTYAKDGYASSFLRVTVPAGATATVDMTLAPFVTTSITIKTSATSASIGGSFVLSGVMSPNDPAMIGKLVHVDVMKPGKTYWSYSSARVIYSDNGAASWWYRYTMVSGMAKGTYQFKAVFDGDGPYEPSTSGPVSVTLGSGGSGGLPTSADGIQVSPGSAYTGGSVVLSGPMDPIGMVGLVMHVNVKKPNRATWTYSSNRVIYDDNGTAKWWYRYTFIKGMAKGTYQFIGIWDGNADYPARVTGVVGVTLR